MNNIMLDIETMGNTPNSAILAIGAVYFDETGTGRSFYHKVCLESSCKIGLEMDADTVLWWLRQSDVARKEFETKGEPIYYVLRQLQKFIKADSFVWGNGASFDNVIVANAFRKLNMPVPWLFYNNRCFRTLKNLYPDIQIPENEVKHNALEDAIWQAQYAVKVFQHLKCPAPIIS
ncbi:MAG TPA: 3'-5' exonuclease [Salinimicrobium sp.]|nr:3'-5' exonuclease [Salinimicrobium sp.]